MAITLEQLSDRTIATIRVAVGAIGFAYAAGVVQIGTPEAPVHTVNIGDGVTPVAVNVYGGSVTAAEFIGALTGNADTATLAASATQLATARLLWGRSFDGTANVVGAIENATTGDFSGNVTAPLFIGDLQGIADEALLAQVALTANDVDGLDVSGTTLAANVVASSLTTIGTLVAGAVPFSLLTPGTAGAGAYVFPSTLATTGLLSANLGLTVTGAAFTVNGAFAHSIGRNVNGETNVLALNNLDATAATLHAGVLLWQLSTTAPATVNAGAIRLTKLAEWTSTASTQDSSMRLQIAIDGALSTGLTLSSSAGTHVATLPGNATIGGTLGVTGIQTNAGTNPTALILSRTSSADNSGMEFRTTGGSVFVGASTGGVLFGINDTNNLAATPWFTVSATAITGGTYNGQTISATAAFTGTVSVASTLTLSNKLIFVPVSEVAEIRTNTVDGSDTAALGLSPGSGLSNTRGAVALLYGNEHASFPGRLYLDTGNISTAVWRALVRGTTFLAVTRPVATNIVAVTGEMTVSAASTFSTSVASPDFIGDLSGNADTASLAAVALVADEATALETARTIFGVSFDGTGNVTGAMSGVTTFTATGLIQTTLITEQMRLRYDASNYFSITVSSAGVATLATVGSGAAHRLVLPNSVAASHIVQNGSSISLDLTGDAYGGSGGAAISLLNAANGGNIKFSHNAVLVGEWDGTIWNWNAPLLVAAAAPAYFTQWYDTSGFPNTRRWTAAFSGSSLALNSIQDDGTLVQNMLLLDHATGDATFSGSLTTRAPTGGAGAWELGIANVVSPTAPNRTVTIEIGGTAYYLAAKTTND